MVILNVSPNMSFGLLQVFHVKHGSLQQNLEQNFLFNPQVLTYIKYPLLFICRWDWTCNLQMVLLRITFQPNAYIHCTIWPYLFLDSYFLVTDFDNYT